MSAEPPGKNQERPVTARVFFALHPPETVATALAEVARRTAERQGGRPTRGDTIHLTLAFLGDIPVAELPRLQAVGDRVRGARFSLRIDRLDYWRHKRLLWAGPSEVPRCLRDLHKQLLAALAESGFRGDLKGGEFTPHITLVRHVSLENPDLTGLGGDPTWPLDWPCSSFALLRSELSSAGPNYTLLRTFTLA